MRKGKKLICMALSLALVTGLMGCGRGSSDAGTEEATETVSVAVGADTPQIGSLAVSATYIGTVTPQEQVSVIPLVSGKILEVNFEVGDYVEAGSVLVRIDDEAARLQLESAEITKKSAELSAQRTLGSTQDLSNISSMTNITAIQYQIASAQRQYEAALENVDNSYDAKDDLKESLKKINSSIDEAEKNYNSLINLANIARNLVTWHDGQWCWVTDVYKPDATDSGDNGINDREGNGLVIESVEKDEISDIPLEESDMPEDPDEIDEEPTETEITGASLRNKAASFPVRFRENNTAWSLRYDMQDNYIMINVVNETPSQDEWNILDAQVTRIKQMGYEAADIGEGELDSAAAALKAQIDALKTQRDTLKSNIDSMDTTINSAERSAANAGDSVGLYEKNLQAAQSAYDIQNGQAYEDTKATLDNQIAAANIGVESAQMQLENYVITAPISGQIEQKNVDEFGMASAGTPVYVISNKDTMTITFYVSEAVKTQMAVGQSVTVERNEQNWTAVITQIGESVNSRTGLFEIKASVEGSDLTNGVSVKVHADTAQTANALLIPYDAVYFSDEQAYVYCVENDTLVKTQVETGLYNDDTIEIISGLSKDSVVVNTWSSQLMDGTKVHIEEASE